MTFDTSIDQSYSKLRQQDRWWQYLCLILLMIAAFILYTVNLGGLPLYSVEEGATAQLAHQIWQAPPHSWQWIFPTVLGQPEQLQPPLFPDLVAFSYKIGGFSRLTTRLPSSLLGIVCMAILYGIGRELFRRTIPTLLACCVYLTFFPAIAQGRLATVDAPLLCFEMFTLWAVLRSRRDLRWSLVTGLGFCLVGLTHSWSLLPLLVLILLFLLWDTPRLLFSFYFYLGLILGMMPLIAWWLGCLHYRESTINLATYLPSLVSAIANNFDLTFNLTFNWLLNRSFAYYLSRTLYYCSPWLITAIYGLRLAWHYRIWGWAKFILVSSSVCCCFFVLAIFINSFYLLPIYPILALAAGIQLDRLRNLPSYIRYPRTWISVFNCSAFVILLVGLYGKLVLDVSFNWLLWAIFSSIILTLVVASSLLARRDIQFISILIWGSYISLLLFFVSPYWI